MPGPLLDSNPQVVNDHLIPLMAEGRIHNLFGIKRFYEDGVVVYKSRDPGKVSESSNEVDDELKVSCDAVIFCTGMRFDYSFLSPEADPCNFPAPEWNTEPNAADLPYPHLYRSLFHPSHVDSLCFRCPQDGFTFFQLSDADLCAQATAALWSGAYTLPSRVEIDKQCEEDYRSNLQRIRAHRITTPGPASTTGLEDWLCLVSGNRIDENLGWGWTGWKYWLSHRTFAETLQGGILTPFVYRLWGADKWVGAKTAIMKANDKA
jgi:dimethylaniline monooxygenase (N-oxide forming)